MLSQQDQLCCHVITGSNIKDEIKTGVKIKFVKYLCHQSINLEFSKLKNGIQNFKFVESSEESQNSEICIIIMI